MSDMINKAISGHRVNYYIVSGRVDVGLPFYKILNRPNFFKGTYQIAVIRIIINDDSPVIGELYAVTGVPSLIHLYETIYCDGNMDQELKDILLKKNKTFL